MVIRRLSDTVINQIAAGEVVERPASVVKELIENALDAGATRIEIATAGGGLNLIRIQDNGCGMAPEELPLALSRHCTSKLSDNIHDIRSLGFRGEALPSIASVARLTLRSRRHGDEQGAEISAEAGNVAPAKPAPCNRGTTVEVRDLFFATPARLKFMKSARAEASAITDAVRRIAIAFPNVHFLLTGSDRRTLEFTAGKNLTLEWMTRVAQVLGADFPENAVVVEAEREGVRLHGHVSIPAFHRGNALQQYVSVNGRPVRDRQIASAIRGAYADYLPRDRHPLAALQISLDPVDVDVNVHPAKADVRFRDPGLVRGLIVGAIREALSSKGIQGSSTGAAAMMRAFREGRPGHASRSPALMQQDRWHLTGFSESSQALFEPAHLASANTMHDAPCPDRSDAPLGAACAQIHENYIIAQTADSLVIVDQHAAHERLVYEALKEALENRPLAAQMLLLPEIVDLPEEDIEQLMAEAANLQRFGLGLERFGAGAVLVRETPAMLGELDAAQLVRDLADELASGEGGGLKDRLHAIASRMACHGSVRSGRRLKADEMNSLLRRMEETPGSGTCNHGRPTFIELKLSDIERLFQRR